MRNRIDRWIDAFSQYENTRIDFFFTQMKINNYSYFIDIGAHWGYYSLLFNNEKSFEQAEIHAFEPDKMNRYQFYSNLFLNKLQDRVTVYNYAISDNDGELRFHHSNENNRGKIHIRNDGESIVKTKKLDSLLKLEGEIIGIKIDVEGHETAVISGMTDLLKKNKCILQVESFSNQFPNQQSKLSELGYSNINSIKSDHYFSN